MANNERMAEMNKNHICPTLFSSKDDASDVQYFENSSVLVSCRNCACNVVRNSSGNEGKGKQSLSNKNKVFEICGIQGFRETDLCDIDLNASSCNDYVNAEKSSDTFDSPGMLSNNSDNPGRSSDKSDSPDLSSDKSESPDLSRDKSDSPDLSSDKSSGSDKSSDISELYDMLHNKPVSPNISSDKSTSPDRSSDKSAGSDRSSDKSTGLDRSSVESLSTDRSSASSDRSSHKSTGLDRSCFKSLSPDRSSDKSASPDSSSEKSASPDKSSDKSTGSDRSSGKSAGSDRSSGKSAGSDRSSDKSTGSDRSSDKSTGSDRSSEKSASPDKSSDKSNTSDSSSVISDRSNDKDDSKQRLSNSLGTSEDNLVVPDNSGDNSDREMLFENSDNCRITSVNCSISEISRYNSDSSNMLIKEIGNFDSSSDHLADKSTIESQINSEKANTVQLCVKRMLQNSKLVSSRITCKNENLEIAPTILNQTIKNPLNTENDGFQGTAPFVNIPKFPQSSIYVLKCPTENIQHHYKVIYLNRQEKHGEAVLNKTNEELDVTLTEKVTCIKSNPEYQTDNFTENIQCNNQDDHLKEKYSQIGISSKTSSAITGSETVDEEATDIQRNGFSPNSSPIKSRFDNGKDLPFILNETDKVGVTEYSQCVSSAKSNCTSESQLINMNYSNKEKQVCTFPKNKSELKMSGSQVEDIKQYQNVTDFGNDWITENLDYNQLDPSFSSLDIIKNVKVMCDSVLDTFQSYVSSIINKAKLKISPDSTMCAVSQSNSETASEDFSTGNTDDEESTTDSDCDIEDSEPKTRITNFFTLFKHLTAEAGTDITAEQVKEDINQQVVLDIYSGFHELRTGDYSNLDLMEKCIQGCLGTMQNTMLKSNDIVKRSSVLLRVETRSFAEMQELNKDLNQLAAEAEDYMHDIDRSLTGLKDFTDDYMYYKECISKELCEFLVEDFPEMFK